MGNTIKTSRYLTKVKPVSAVGSGGTSVGNHKPPDGTGSKVSDAELQQAVLKLKVIRYLDDGLQTLGKMQILNADGTISFEMTTAELPYRGNANSISCIPPGKFLVRSYNSAKYGDCFWIYANEAGAWEPNAIFGNGFKRQAVLIHKAPASTWLMGCIGPGFKFDQTNLKGRTKFNAKYSPDWKAGSAKGNPYGTGEKSMKGISTLAQVPGLWSMADVTKNSFYMTIENMTSKGLSMDINTTPIYTEPNSAAKFMNIKTGEPLIFMGGSGENPSLTNT